MRRRWLVLCAVLLLGGCAPRQALQVQAETKTSLYLPAHPPAGLRFLGAEGISPRMAFIRYAQGGRSLGLFESDQPIARLPDALALPAGRWIATSVSGGRVVRVEWLSLHGTHIEIVAVGLDAADLARFAAALRPIGP